MDAYFVQNLRDIETLDAEVYFSNLDGERGYCGNKKTEMQTKFYGAIHGMKK